MGKYMRQQKPKSSADVALVDTVGVRTRAKTQALKRLQKFDPETRTGLSYLQLRSRRLEKPPIAAKRRAKRVIDKNAPNSKPNCEFGGNGGGSDDCCFGENLVDFEVRERSTRESTPCSLIKVTEMIRTPCSSTRPTGPAQAHTRAHNPILSHIPTAHDMDEFFAGAEVQQQQQFIDKYNFDPVNEVPLPGRYEWVKVKP